MFESYGSCYYEELLALHCGISDNDEVTTEQREALMLKIKLQGLPRFSILSNDLRKPIAEPHVFFSIFYTFDVCVLRHVAPTPAWDYFMFVQRWPQSSCEIVNASGSPCRFPPYIKRWTIHGLWPSGTTYHPFHCQNWTFDLSQVFDVEGELLLHWPNIYLNESFDSLWKHEYEKHGTCAAEVPAFEHQHDYFEQTLNLEKKYDIQEVLQQGGIYPREEPYDFAQINATVHGPLDKRRCIWCGNVVGIGQVLSQSIACLNKQLEWIDCPVCERLCDASVPVLYQPLHYNRDYTS